MVICLSVSRKPTLTVLCVGRTSPRLQSVMTESTVVDVCLFNSFYIFKGTVKGMPHQFEACVYVIDEKRKEVFIFVIFRTLCQMVKL